jgi:rhomboid protease GluP
MANCISCGRPLSRSIFGPSSSVCADCRNTAVTVPASGSFPGSPADVPQPQAIVRSYPPLTTALVGINVAVYLAMVLSGVSPVEPHVPQLLRWGANFGPLSLGPQPWRILTSNYLHGGMLHIALNMWCLWNLGSLAERIFDRTTYLLTYTFCGLAGSLASLWWHPTVVGIGASGAIFGVAGALIAALYLGHLPIPKAALRGTLRSLLTFAAYNLFFGALPGIDNSAHIGGLLAGLALGSAVSSHLTSPPEVRNGWRRAVFIAAGLLLAMLFLVIQHANGGVPPESLNPST